MPDLTIAELASLDGKGYTAELKLRLRDNDAWAILVEPQLIQRTRFTLNRMIDSIDGQIERITAEGTATESWLKGINSLRRLVKLRLDALVILTEYGPSTSKEIRAWRTFSALLAAALDEEDSSALDALKTPYGGLTAREWLAVRREKEAAR